MPRDIVHIAQEGLARARAALPGPFSTSEGGAGMVYRLMRQHWGLGQETGNRTGIAIVFGDGEGNARFLEHAVNHHQALCTAVFDLRAEGARVAAQNAVLEHVFEAALAVDAANSNRAAAQVQDCQVRTDYEAAIGRALDRLRLALDEALRVRIPGQGGS